MRDGANRRSRPAVMRIMLVAGAVFGCGYLLAQEPQRTAPPAADLNQIMRALFFPHSNVVFSTQRQDPAGVQTAAEPSGATDPLTGVFGGWTAVENSALLLVDGADLLMTPGRKCSNGRDVPLAAPDWVKFVDELREAGRVAYRAAVTKNTDKMFEASDVLNTSCTNCHNRYRRANRCQ